jgi:DNA-binding MarR family transcriptional regulator
MNGYHLAGDPMPPHLSLPESLLTEDLTATELKAYMLLLRRSFLSARSPKWMDGDGRIFLYYPIRELAGTLGRSESSVKKALNRLEELELIRRQHQGTGKTNRIYVKFPSDMEAVDTTDTCVEDTKGARGADTMPDRERDTKVPPSNLYGDKRNDLSEGSKEAAPARPRRKHGFLSLWGWG